MIKTKEERKELVGDFQTEIESHVELIQDDFIVAKNNATYSENYFTLRLKIYYSYENKQAELETFKQDKKEQIKVQEKSFVRSFPKLADKSFTNSKSNIKELRTAIFKMDRYIDSKLISNNESLYTLGLKDIRTNKTFTTKMSTTLLDKLSNNKKSLINLASYYN